MKGENQNIQHGRKSASVASSEQDPRLKIHSCFICNPKQQHKSRGREQNKNPLTHISNYIKGIQVKTSKTLKEGNQHPQLQMNKTHNSNPDLSSSTIRKDYINQGVQSKILKTHLQLHQIRSRFFTKEKEKEKKITLTIPKSPNPSIKRKISETSDSNEQNRVSKSDLSFLSYTN